MMVVLIRRRHLIGAMLFLCFLGGMSAILWQGSAARRASVQASAETVETGTVYVVDPGHGGEDGGAVGSDGTVESGVNLGIALRLNDLLRFCGQTTRMTRREDVSIYSDGAVTLREKKVSDLKNRVALVNSVPGAVLVSIHQNKLPEAPRVRGAQVFYNTVEGAKEAAGQIQASLNGIVNTEKGKEPKQIPSTIYLMKNITAPGILIECGFLSNPEETASLLRPEYQTRLAAAIVSGLFGETPPQEETSITEGT